MLAHPTALSPDRLLALAPCVSSIGFVCISFFSGLDSFFLLFCFVFSLAVASRHRPGHDSQAEWHCSVKGNTARNRSKNGFLISKFFFLFSECAGAQIDSRVRRLYTAGPCTGQEL
jgi:hypothetical protein